MDFPLQNNCGKIREFNGRSKLGDNCFITAYDYRKFLEIISGKVQIVGSRSIGEQFDDHSYNFQLKFQFCNYWLLYVPEKYCSH